MTATAYPFERLRRREPARRRVRVDDRALARGTTEGHAARGARRWTGAGARARGRELGRSACGDGGGPRRGRVDRAAGLEHGGARDRAAGARWACGAGGAAAAGRDRARDLGAGGRDGARGSRRRRRGLAGDRVDDRGLGCRCAERDRADDGKPLVRGALSADGGDFVPRVRPASRSSCACRRRGRFRRGPSDPSSKLASCSAAARSRVTRSPPWRRAR